MLQQLTSGETAQVINRRISEGSIVWCNGKHKAWPGLILDESICDPVKETRGNYLWVYRFNELYISKIPVDDVEDFISNFSRYWVYEMEVFEYTGKAYNEFKKAVIDAIKLLATRYKVTIPDKEDLILKWAIDGFQLENCADKQDVSWDIPEPVLSIILAAQTRCRVLKNRQIQESSLINSMERETKKYSSTIIKKTIQESGSNCLICENIVVTEYDHPLFETIICIHCYKNLKENMYTYADDGDQVHCAVCSNFGSMFACENKTCSRVYCMDCIGKLCGANALKIIQETNPWFCFLCDVNQRVTSIVNVRVEWRKKILNMYDGEFVTQNMDLIPKRPIRVLSLFDGIGSGYYTLRQLNISIEKYYASEIDKNALMVSSTRFGNKIIQLGAVESINRDTILNLKPIDLLIGGFPCKDLSAVNPLRKGLFDVSGNGILFHEFVRILHLLEEIQGKTFFWLLENVASMSPESKDFIDRHLECKAVNVDSKYFTPQRRARLFWGNIPGIVNAPKIEAHIYGEPKTLQSILTPNVGRIALVDKVCTVTSCSNSLRQGIIFSGHSIVMNGIGDKLWISELEKLFGFPEHFTDVGNLSISMRLRLLGQAWSIPTIMHILRPLTDFYEIMENTFHL